MRTAFDAFGAWESTISTPANEDHSTDDEGGGRRFRTIFISDLHLGKSGCKAEALLDFLKSHPSD